MIKAISRPANTSFDKVNTSLTNVQLANGYLSNRYADAAPDNPIVLVEANGGFDYTFLDHVGRYFANGLPQAVLIPYAEVEVSAD